MSNFLARHLLPTTKALHVFEVAAELESFSEAATTLNMSQSAVSRQISDLEKLLGQALFIRQRQRVYLTDIGRYYARVSREILQKLQEETFAIMTQSQQRSLKLAILPTFGTKWLLPRLAGFCQAYPDITIDFMTITDPVDFWENQIDIALHFGTPNWQPGKHIHVKQDSAGDENSLCRDGYRFDYLCGDQILPVAHPEICQKIREKGLSPLSEQSLLALNSRLNDWQIWCQKHGFEPPLPSEISYKFEQISTLTGAVASGLGVALLPLRLIEDELMSGKLQIIAPAPMIASGKYYLVCLEARQYHPPIQAFRNWILAEMALSDEG